MKRTSAPGCEECFSKRGIMRVWVRRFGFTVGWCCGKRTNRGRWGGCWAARRCATVKSRKRRGSTGGLERWLSALRREGYIETTAAQEGISIRITKAKKFPQAVRKSAEGVRKIAGSGTQNCGANRAQDYMYEQLAGGMNSSSIVRIKEREAQRENPESCGNQDHEQKQNRGRNQRPGEYESPNQNPSGLGQNQNQNQFQNREQDQHRYFPWELRLHQQLLRAERDAEVRRELAVGTGPLDRR